MTELFPNISEITRKDAEIAWEFSRNLAPMAAANFLAKYISAAPEEEQEFLKFYFNLQLEIMKDG